MDSFFDEKPCCLDSWLSLWLRAHIKNRSELRDGPFQSWLRELAHKGLTTNMGLESLLSEIKSAVPRARAAGPCAEKVAYLGCLTQLMQRHLAAGRRDARQTTFQDMQQLGIPLDVRRQHTKQSTLSRPDSAYVMTNLHAFRQVRPECSVEDIKAERLRLFQEWAAMGSDLKQEFKKAWGSGAATVDHDELAMDVSSLDLDDVFDCPSWNPGDEEWPVSEAACKLLRDKCPTARTDGIASKVGPLRWAAREKLLAKDENIIQEGDKFMHRLSCPLRHPGLCKERDSAIYDQALALAAVLESFFGYDRQRMYFRLLPPGDHVFEHPQSSLNDDVTVYFAHKRERRLHAQVTHVWIRCQYMSEG